VLFLFKEAQASACALYFPFRTRPVAHAPFSNEKKVVARISRYSLFTTHYSLLTFCLCSFFSTSPNLKTQSKEKSMSSLSPKDRVSLCLFTFEDGRRCRTPRTGNHPTSASTTPKRSPAPKPPINSPKTSPASSPATTSPPTISAPPSRA